MCSTYTVQWAVRSVQCAVGAVMPLHAGWQFWPKVAYSDTTMHCSVECAEHTLCIVLFAVRSVQCALCTVHCTVGAVKPLHAGWHWILAGSHNRSVTNMAAPTTFHICYFLNFFHWQNPKINTKIILKNGQVMPNIAAPTTFCRRGFSPPLKVAGKFFDLRKILIRKIDLCRVNFGTLLVLLWYSYLCILNSLGSTRTLCMFFEVSARRPKA